MAQSDQRRRAQWTRVASAAYDAVQAATSVVDVATDVAVLETLARSKDDEPFFLASLLVFALAQMSYAMLFVVAYGRKKKTVKARVALFLAALPLAQLVPLFVWIESMGFGAVDRMLRFVGLEPTSATHAWSPVPLDESGVGRAGDDDDPGQLWTLVHKKMRSNAGFLVEAVAEAIPQALLQVTYVATRGHASPLFVASILLSVFVIVSKGYLFAFSIDTATFAFNVLAVVADVTSMFACFLFAFGPGGGLQGPWTESPTPLLTLEAFRSSPASTATTTTSRLYHMWGSALAWMLACMGVFTFFVTLFANCDDHLKFRMGAQQRGPRLEMTTESALFEFWLTRLLGWVLVVIPVCVGATLVKVSAAGLWWHRSVDPGQALHPAAYRAVHAFLGRAHGLGGELNHRLVELNRMLAWAVDRHLTSRTARDLFAIVAREETPDNVNALRSMIESSSDARSVVGGGFRRVSRPGTGIPVYETIPLEDATAQAHADALADRARVRKENRERLLERDFDEFERRSAVYRWLRGVQYKRGAVEDLVGERERVIVSRWDVLTQEDTKTDAALRLLGTAAFGATVVSGCVTAASVAVAALLGLVVPIYGAFQTLAGARFSPKPGAYSYEALLGLSLALVFAVAVGGMAWLSPRVVRFQSLARDVFVVPDDMHEADECRGFWSPGMRLFIEESEKRYRLDKGRRVLRANLEARVGPDLARLILSFVAGAKREWAMTESALRADPAADRKAGLVLFEDVVEQVQDEPSRDVTLKALNLKGRRPGRDVSEKKQV